MRVDIFRIIKLRYKGEDYFKLEVAIRRPSNAPRMKRTKSDIERTKVSAALNYYYIFKEFDTYEEVLAEIKHLDKLVINKTNIRAIEKETEKLKREYQ